MKKITLREIAIDICFYFKIRLEILFGVCDLTNNFDS